MLNLCDAKVVDVDVMPHYAEEKSGIKLITFVPKLIYLLIRLFFSRVFKKTNQKKSKSRRTQLFLFIYNAFLPNSIDCF